MKNQPRPFPEQNPLLSEQEIQAHFLIEAITSHPKVTGEVKIVSTPVSSNSIEFTISDESSEYDTILKFYGEVSPEEPKLFFVHGIDIEERFQRSGIGIAFYQKLREVVKTFSCEFIGSVHSDTDKARYFLKKQGMYLIDELKSGKIEDIIRNLVEKADAEDDFYFHTIGFLYPEQIPEYVQQQYLTMDVEERLQIKVEANKAEEMKLIRVPTVRMTLKQLESILENAEKLSTADLDTVCEILARMYQAAYPTAEMRRGIYSEDETIRLTGMRTLLGTVSAKVEAIAQTLSLDDLRKNKKSLDVISRR